MSFSRLHEHFDKIHADPQAFNTRKVVVQDIRHFQHKFENKWFFSCSSFIQKSEGKINMSSKSDYFNKKKLHIPSSELQWLSYWVELKHVA